MQAEVITQNESTALVKPTTERAIVMAKSLQEDTEQRALIAQYVAHHMKDGVDYGTIPGTDKPTLLKPGAEKLTDLFRCTSQFDILNKIEDWDRGLFHYEFRVRICSREHGTVLAEGYGSANSKEGRYRWRNAGRKCPNCGKETIIKGKAEYGGGWLCFPKRGGCGAKWKEGDQVIAGQALGKVENDDIFTLVNTILKMAKKRALVDGAIALARCSDIFTQDVEDLIDQGHGDQEQAPRQERKTHAENKAAAKERLTKGPGPSQELQAVLAGIASAETIEELAMIQSAAARLTDTDKKQARAEYAKRRDALSQKMPDWDEPRPTEDAKEPDDFGPPAMTPEQAKAALEATKGMPEREG